MGTTILARNSAVNTISFTDLLERAGYRVHGNRADCPQCSGHSRLTVAIRGEVYYCHRCKIGGNVRTIARRHGLSLPPPRLRLADQPKAEFRQWLSAQMNAMSRQEYRLYRRKIWGEAALSFYHDFEPAWCALARWYQQERAFALFWETVTDKIGRYGLYRAWREHGCCK